MYHAKDFTVDMLEPGLVKKAYVSHVTDPDNFYIQLSCSMDNLDRIATYLENLYEGKTGEEERMWHLGDPCAAVYDGLWSRGRVTGTPHNGDSVEVTFVDYGNKDNLMKRSIFPLTPEMMTIPVLSHHCCLEGVSSPENFSSPNVIEEFQNLFMDKELTAQVVCYDEYQDVYSLLLFDEENLLNKQFAEKTGSDFMENASVCNGTEQNATAAKVAQAKPNRGIARALGRVLPDRGKGQNQLPQMFMKVGEKANVSVSYVSSPSEWWCNLSSYNSACDDMAEKMEATYNKMGPNVGLLHNLRPGVLCAALVEADNVWYRACVEKVMGPSVLLTFLDYGNTDLVVVGNIKELMDEFRTLPVQAFRCCLHDVTPMSGPWTDDAADKFEKLVMYKDYTATVMAKDPMGRLHMSLMDCSNNSDVATSFLKIRSDARRGSPPSISPERDLAKLPALDIEIHSKAEVFLSWVKTPGDFFVQLVDNQSVLDTLANDILKFYTSSRAEPAVGVQIGSMVAAKFSEDGDWYRAVVTNMSETTCEVEFVDYGNSDTVPTDSLQMLTEEFTAIPSQAVRCSLPAIRPLSQGSTWSRDAKQFLESLTDAGASCTFLGHKGDTYEVDLDVNGRNVAREMKAAAVVRESSPMAPAGAVSSRVQKYQYMAAPRGKSHQAYVAFVNSVESFYLQLFDNIADLEQLMEEMQEFYEAGKGKPITNCMIGLPCAAKYEADGQWYRAEIRSFTVRDVDVFFVDYGNTQSSPKNSIFQMEPDFVSRVHTQAIHCQLSIPESRNTAEAQLENFNAFTEDEELEVVIKDKEGSKLLVDLKKGGVSLTDELKGAHTAKATVEKSTSSYTPGAVSPGQTVSAFASFIESPARLWVQLAGCDDELTSMMETLSDHYGSGAEPPLNNPSPGQPCVALYDVDTHWYRASVMSVHGMEVKVQFVDYGNMELVDRQNIKAISAVFMSSPLLAVECCLDGFQSSFMSDDAVLVMEELMSEQELSITFNGPKNVTVKVGNVDIAQALQEKGLGPRVQKSAVQVKTPPSQFSSHRNQTRDSGFSSSLECSSIEYKEPVPPSGSAEAIITHIDEKCGIIYIQLLSSESQLEQLSSKLQSLYNSCGSPLKGFPVIGLACCAKYHVDNCWYRALVEQISGEQVQVQFVDYGNSDTVPANSLKSISTDLATSPKHAFICKLKGLKSWTAQSYKALCRYAMDEQLNIRFVTSSSPFEIQVSVRGQDLLQMMFKSLTSPPQPSYDRFNSREKDSQQRAPQPARNQGFGGDSSLSLGSSGNRPAKQSVRPQVAAGDEKIANNKPYAGSPMKVEVVEQVFQSQKTPSVEQETYVSHVAEDGTFYVQLIKDIAVIDEMTNKVENCPPAPHPSPIVGAACGAQYSDDGAWYRGQIQSVSGSSVVVVFIDFGNSETCEVSTLKPLPADLLTPPLAYHCQATVGMLTTEQQETFRAASGDKEYLITFREGVPYDVTVKDEDGTDLATTIFRPTTVPQPKVPSQKVHAVVSHVGQDGHFYLQFSNDLDPIADFREEVQTVCEGLTEKLDSFDKGQVCLAKFSDDDAWYRASVVSSSQDEVTVLFLDYGNTETVQKNNLLVLPPSLMARPVCAYNCKIPGVKKWKEGQKRKFEAMTDGKTMNACFLSSKPPYVVELTIDIGLELEEDEYSEEITENEIPEAEVAEKAEFNQDKEAAEESEEKFEVAEEPAEEEEYVEQLADNPEEPPKSAPKKQEPAETGGSEEEFSDAQESPEDSAPPAEDGEGRRPSEDGSPSKDRSSAETAIPSFPAQIPPALDACIVSHVNSDGTFYLQLLSEDDSREKMSDTLQDDCESVDCKPVVRPLVNLACCARFSNDGAWYRATVEKVDVEMVEVLFVDFGNTDCIPVGDLRELSVDSLQVPPLAYKCVLEDCDTELVGSKLEETTLDQTLTVTFSTTETIPYSVNLQLESGVNISTMLVKPSEQPSVQSAASEETEASQDNVSVVSSQGRKCVGLERGQRVKVLVSHVVSPSLFYVQRDDTSAQLEEMTDAMFDHYSSLAEEDGVIENLAVDQLCVGQFGEEGSWYRAVVRSISSEVDTCSLFYVDYGNRDTVPRSSVRELLADFEALPWQCVSCSLAGVSCQGDWSDEVNTAFEDMVASKSVTAEILSGNGVDETYSAHIFDDQKSAAESLLALNLPGLEVAEISSPPSSESVAAVEKKSSSTADTALDNPSQEVVESGLVEEEEEDDDAMNRTVEDFDESEQDFSRHLHECPAQETVDDLDESEQEFSRQLKSCTARMESTMMEEVRSARQGLNSTHGGELSGMTSRGEQGGKEEEEEEDFEDAVEAEQDSDAEEGNALGDLQVTCSCVSDGLAELEWLDIHVCVAVSALEFWCQLPSARSILSGTTLGIERARASDVVKNAKVGNLYLVCDPPQTNYRGKVLSDCDDEGRVLVLKLDYGTEERVSTRCLHPLAKHQLELPAQAFCCCLGDDNEVSATPQWLNDLITSGEAVDSELQVKIVGRKPTGTLLVDVRERPGSLSLKASSSEAEAACDEINSGKQEGEVSEGVEGSMETMLEISHSQPVLQSTILGDTMSQSRMERSEGDKDYVTHLLEDDKDYEVTVVPGGRPDSFYVIKTSAKGLLDALADDIEEEVKEKADSPAEDESITINTPCLVMDDQTSKWFRGQVKSAGDKLKVLCVDRGVEVEVGKESVCELPPRLLDTPTQAVLCCLAHITPVDGHWCEAALSLFTDFISKGPLKLSSCGLGSEQSGYKVRLCEESGGEGDLSSQVPETSINRALVEVGYAEAVQGSPLELVLQVERTIDDPEKVEELETSFTVQSLLRRNSLELDSDGDDSTEQDRDVVTASGDAPNVATESDEESKQH